MIQHVLMDARIRLTMTQFFYILITLSLNYDINDTDAKKLHTNHFHYLESKIAFFTKSQVIKEIH